MNRRWRLTLGLAALLCLTACSASPPPLLDSLRVVLAEARTLGAPFCAPADFAAAEADIDFAESAYARGRSDDGQRLLLQASGKLETALAGSRECRSDLDGDGVLDVSDLDPHRAEDFDAYRDEDGAPDYDNDFDGRLDGDDKCPDEAEDYDQFEDEDGCPDVDNDYDGVVDGRDLCVEAEDIDGFADEDGCPDPDNDRDGFADAQDACPNDPETINDFLDDDGCPDRPPQKRKFVQLPLVGFLGGSTYLTKTSRANLTEFAGRLLKNADLHVRIESHVYARGDEPAALELTRQRAEAVRAFLVDAGVPAKRLTALGFGSSRPTTDNETAAGRGKNERIEFVIYLP